jgi:fatty-acyl-CoA synthase
VLDRTHAADVVNTARSAAAGVGQRGLVEGFAVGAMLRAGIRTGPPRRLLEALGALNDLGQIGAAGTLAALRAGPRTGLIDDLGALSFAELQTRSDALACALRDRGIGEQDGIGILCRNHRGLLDITFAAAKLGARLLYLNTDFAAPQLVDVCAREGVTLLVHDEEFSALVDGVSSPRGTLLAWGESREDGETLEQLIASAEGRRPGRPARHSRVVLLTSGTTGMPKGAPRSSSRSLAPIGALLSKVPLHAGEATVVAPPIFHALGFSQTIMAFVLGCTTITRRRFDPSQVLDDIHVHRASALIVVPVMLRRIVTALEQDPSRYDTSSLRIVLVSGSQLEVDLIARARATLGEKLYNFYGSTEVAYAAFATPEDLAAAPGCVGRPPFGTRIRLYDEQDNPIRQQPGRVGRIFVGNTFQFEGYTGGGGKEIIDGLMSTGDVGHLDEASRLFIDGRDDDMIVSGGENVFPREVEDLLAEHPACEEVSVVGRPDDEFGQRLEAFVVPRAGCPVSEEELKAYVGAHLARYKVPRRIEFVDQLPRTTTGKVLTRELGRRPPGPAASRERRQ